MREERTAADGGAYLHGRNRYLRNGMLVPRLDVEPYGFAGDVDAHFLFARRFDGTPRLDFGASQFLRLIFLPD